MHPLKDKACIVGVGETAYTRGTDRSVLNQILRAVMAAPGPGNSTLQATFSVFDQVTGRPFSLDEPLKWGPRH